MMTALLGKEDRKEIARLFSALTHDVRIVLFTSRTNCAYCPQTRDLLGEIAALSERVKLEALDIDVEISRARELGVEFAPTTVILASNGAKLYYVGMPGGRQLRSVVEDIVDASRGRTDMEEGTRETIRRVTAPTSIKVFVLPTCLYSPLVVRSAHRFAIENQKIRAIMVETLEFPRMAQRFNVVGTPRTVINDSVVFDGAPSESSFAERVLEASTRPT